MSEIRQYRAGILHGGGYVGGELLRLLLAHPHVAPAAATSRTFAGRPVWAAHQALRGATDLFFVEGEPRELADQGLDVVFIAAEHGKSAATIAELLAAGYEGRIVDLSADFRFRDETAYEQWFGFKHPAPELIPRFQYGIPEIFAPYPADTQFVANPGCFASAITFALWPLAGKAVTATVTALTGASGSGTRPREGTHFPTRDGNVRAYKVLAHQHLPEVQQTLGERVRVAFVPASGPWTRGIWGTAHVDPAPDADEVAALFEKAYGSSTFVRTWPDQLPELRFAVNTPFCDVGWVVRDGACVIGFSLDNLLKGAASQAIQNMNLILDLPESAGLLAQPDSHVSIPL